jgi:hypothetical protein
LDAIIALPMARFRTTLDRLSSDELAALDARIAVQIIRNRWARGGHGIARHRSPNALGLLARRQTETRRALSDRQTIAPAVVRLPLAEPMLQELAGDGSDRQAA